MTIMQKSDGLGAGDGGGETRAAQDFGDGGHREIFAAGDLITLLDDGRLAIFEGIQRIDPRPVFVVGEQTVSVGVNASGDGGAVHVGGGGVNRVMPVKSDALLRELPERGSIVRGHGVRSHAIPNDHDDVAIVGGGRLLRKRDGACGQ